jgi:hypothetical protein
MTKIDISSQDGDIQGAKNLQGFIYSFFGTCPVLHAEFMQRDSDGKALDPPPLNK